MTKTGHIPTENPAARPSEGKRRVRSVAFLTLFAIAFLSLGWSAYWYAAHRMAISELQSALAFESREGRDWTCAKLLTGGYPFSVDFDCEGLVVTARIGERSIVAHARKALVHAPIYTPKRVTIDLTDPADILVDGAQVRVKWSKLQLSARGLPDRLDRFSVAGADVAVHLADDSANAAATIAALLINLRHTPGADDLPLNFEASLAGIESPVLDAVTAGADRATFAAIGSVTHANKLAGGSLASRMDSWREAGGRVSANLSLVKGRVAAQAEGSVGLDQGRRLDGKFDLRMLNSGAPLADLAHRFGVRGPLASLLVGSLISPDASTGEARLAISFENGRLDLGPFKRIIALPPLY